MTYKTTGLTVELMALRDANGLINAAQVVKWARRNSKSMLHQEFTWDDAEAGEKHRVWEARQLIAVHVVDDSGGRSLVSLSIDRSGGGGYREVSEVVKMPNLRAIMLEDALADLRRLQAKYQRLQELVDVWNATSKVEETVKGRRGRPKKAA